MWDQLSTTGSNLPKQTNEELLVAVNYNQLETMASETVDLIDWSHPPCSWAVPPEQLMHSRYQCGLSSTRIDLSTSAREATTLPMLPLRVQIYKRKCQRVTIKYGEFKTSLLFPTVSFITPLPLISLSYVIEL